VLLLFFLFFHVVNGKNMSWQATVSFEIVIAVPWQWLNHDIICEESFTDSLQSMRVCSLVSTLEQYIHSKLSAKRNNSVIYLLVTTVLRKKRKQNWRSLLSLVKRYMSWNLLNQSTNFSGNLTCHFLIPLGEMQL